MTKADFADAASRCSLRATTYLYRDGILVDEPLIDFTKESRPAEAMKCFEAAMEQIDRGATERGVVHISRIWEYRT
jgi:hypothetical protein